MAVSSDIQTAAETVMPDVVAVTVEPLTGGSSAFVAALALESAAGEQRRVVFRQHTNRTDKEQAGLVASKEFHLTKELRGHDLGVARPLALHDGETADGPWLVTEWVEGTTVVAEPDVDAALSQMADYLARLHQVDPGRLSAPGIADIEDPVEALLLDDAVERSAKQALRIDVERRPNAKVLLHGDFWPGNVMFESGKLVAVVDWEDAAWGDPLADLACARVELACAYGHDASERFTSLYLSFGQHLDARDLPLWDIYVSSTALASMHRWGLSPDDEAARRQMTTWFLEAATERLHTV